MAKYFEVNRTKGDKVFFHSLFKSEDGVRIDTKEYFGKLINNSIIKADEQSLDTVFEKKLGD